MRVLPGHSLRLRLALAYGAAVMIATLGFAIFRDLTESAPSEGGVLRLYAEMREPASRRIPWVEAPPAMDRWAEGFAVQAESDSMWRRLVQVSVVDGSGTVLSSAGPGSLEAGRRLRELMGEEAGIVLNEVFAFPVQCAAPAPRLTRNFRLKDGSRRLESGHDLAIVAVQDDETGYVYGAVVRELEPTVLGNLWPLAGGLVRNAPAPLLCGLVLIALTYQIVIRRIGRLSAGAREWSRGNFARRIEPGTPDELGCLARDLNAMAVRLGDLLRAREDLAAAGERNRLARDLHDAVKQHLFAAKLRLAVAQGGRANDAQTARALADAQGLVEAAHVELTSLLGKLRPSSNFDLEVALEVEARRWSRGCGVPIRTAIEPGLEAPTRVGEAFVRLLQEALANVARHSEARAVSVTLGKEGDELVMAVRDDGRGFDLGAEDGAGLGLASMGDRMREVGGRAQIESERGWGTRIIARVPVAVGRRPSGGTLRGVSREPLASPQ